MESDELCFLSIATASQLVASRQLSPVDLVNAHLERIEKTESKLNSFVTLLRDESVAAARRAEKAILSGDHVGPLHGIPIGLKDLY